MGPGAVVPADVLHEPPGRLPRGSARPACRSARLSARRRRLSATALYSTGPCGPRAGDLAVAGEIRRTRPRSVLAAPVGVEDHDRFRVAGGDRVGQGVRDELGTQVIGQGEPDDAAGGDVDHGGRYSQPSQVRQVGDVAAPGGVDLPPRRR